MPDRTCFECKHMHIHCDQGYSEQTPAGEPEWQCNKNKWGDQGSEDKRGISLVITCALLCTEFEADN